MPAVFLSDWFLRFFAAFFCCMAKCVIDQWKTSRGFRKTFWRRMVHIKRALVSRFSLWNSQSKAVWSNLWWKRPWILQWMLQWILQWILNEFTANLQWIPGEENTTSLYLLFRLTHTFVSPVIHPCINPRIHPWFTCEFTHDFHLWFTYAFGVVFARACGIVVTSACGKSSGWAKKAKKGQKSLKK